MVVCSVVDVHLIRVAERLAVTYQDDALRPVALVRRGEAEGGEVRQNWVG